MEDFNLVHNVYVIVTAGGQFITCDGGVTDVLLDAQWIPTLMRAKALLEDGERVFMAQVHATLLNEIL